MRFYLPRERFFVKMLGENCWRELLIANSRGVATHRGAGRSEVFHLGGDGHTARAEAMHDADSWPSDPIRKSPSKSQRATLLLVASSGTPRIHHVRLPRYPTWGNPWARAKSGSV